MRAAPFERPAFSCAGGVRPAAMCPSSARSFTPCNALDSAAVRLSGSICFPDAERALLAPFVRGFVAVWAVDAFVLAFVSAFTFVSDFARAFFIDPHRRRSAVTYRRGLCLEKRAQPASRSFVSLVIMLVAD